MKRSPSTSLLVAAAFLLSPLGAYAQGSFAETDAPANETPSAWFVELQGTPTADGGSPAALAQEKQAFRAAAKKAGIQLTERFSYDALWDGLSVEVTPRGLARLARLPEVKNLYPVVAVALPENPPGEAPELSTAIVMTQADIAQNELGLTGHGVRVAIMDTGLDYDHPDLGGCFGPGCRVEMGFDLVGDAYNNDSSSPGYNPVPTPDPFPDDCNGHGTHVAGIVGADGAVRGVAPGVVFHAYRVFGCDGSTSADIMLAAMERVLADGADVLNMSIGSAFQWPQYPTAQGSDRLVNHGVVVVASAGNDGARGVYSLSAPSVGSKVISVASFDNTDLKRPLFTVSPDDLDVSYNSGVGGSPPPVAGTSPMARTGTTATVNDACDAVAPAAGSLTGKIALIRRGSCSFHEKVRNAQSAGAIGVVIYNNVAGTVTPNVAGPVPITIPVVAITAAEGAVIDGRLAAGAVDLTWTSRTLATPIATANLISSFSSYGLSPDLTLKPDVGAPGGSIRSTYPLELGGYTNLSGTSMSSPHVAGAVALLLEAHPHTPAQAVRDILQNSASPRLWRGNPALGFLETVHRQGAGMLQIADAARATTRVTPAKLSLGEHEAGSPAIVRTLTLSHQGGAAVTYDVSHEPALTTGGSTFAPSFFASFAALSFSAASVTVPAGGTAAVDVTIAPSATMPDRSQYGGWIVLTPQGGGTALRVPYAGFNGDYQSIQVLVPTPAGLPQLAKLEPAGFVLQPGGATYTMQGDDIPYILVHLEHQSRELRLEVFDADTGKAWHRFLSLNYFGHNSAATSFFAFAWDGFTTNGNKSSEVPNGRYVVQLTVRKALGDATNPAHFETWTSPVITLARP